MRLAEFATDYMADQAGVLMTILRHLTARNPGGARIPTNNVLKLLHNQGYNFNYYDLDSLIKGNEQLKQLVNNYDSSTMTIGKEAPEPEDTGAEPDQDPRQVDQPETDQQSLNVVDKMAKSAI